jgi:hypothetical protein
MYLKHREKKTERASVVAIMAVLVRRWKGGTSVNDSRKVVFFYLLLCHVFDARAGIGHRYGKYSIF